MENPWRTLRMEAPFVHDADTPAVAAFNFRANAAHRIQTDVLPEPYIGRKDAPIVLLNLNPGFDEYACQTYSDQSAHEIWRKNALHESLDYPFYVLDPQFAHSGAALWWQRKLKEPIQFAGKREVASNFLCIEYCPYPSRSFKALPEPLPSQRYSFDLAEQAIERNAVIVLMRGRRLWESAVPRLMDYPRLFRLNSTQNVAISRRNCAGEFPHIEVVLRSESSTHV